jgi:hypothetical protein
VNIFSTVGNSPVIFTSGFISTIRFNALMYVDLPQPDGPITAVTSFSFCSRSTEKSACFFPYHKFSPSVRNTASFAGSCSSSGRFFGCASFFNKLVINYLPFVGSFSPAGCEY